MKGNRKKIIVVIVSLLAVILTSLICTHFPTLSKAEKAVFRRWYLHNNGAKTAIDDPAANSMPFVVPRVGIDINWNWLGPDDYFSSLHDTNEAVVAIIDTGVDFSNHKDGERYLWTNEGEVPNDGIDNDHNGYIDDIHGYNFCQSGKDVAYYQNSCEENNHGTLCAGIIACIVSIANRDVDMGQSDCPLVKIMSLKVLGSDVSAVEGDSETLVDAIRYAEANGARVCNLSLNIDDYSEDLYTVMKNSKMLFVVSAGNGYGRGMCLDDSPQYPASFDLANMITVANLNYNGHINKTSNYGKNTVDIAAPGTSIYSTTADGEFQFATGTSMAAPMVSATSALLFVMNPLFVAKEVKTVILDNSTPLDDLRDVVGRGGMLNLGNALISTYLQYSTIEE